MLCLNKELSRFSADHLGCSMSSLYAQNALHDFGKDVALFKLLDSLLPNFAKQQENLL